MHPWHGFDRVIAGMANYYRTHTDTHDYKVYLNIVGFGVPELVDSYKKDVAKHQLEKYIIFHSALYGKELDAVFEQSDMGIGSLARHRSGIDKIKTLKNREYAARGIPLFIQKRMMTLSINHTYLRQHRTIRPLTSKK